MDWQPIETAPKDGRQIILYFPAYFDEKVAVYKWELDCCVNTGGVWATIDAFSYPDGEEAPTHWMPLPEPPRCK